MVVPSSRGVVVTSDSELHPIPTGIPIPGDLLRIGAVGRKKDRSPNAVPLMMEFSVNPETGPFLVSSSRGLMWVTPRSPKIRAASRLISLGSFFMEVVQEVSAMGKEADWGNTHPLTPEGLLHAIAHLRSYDLADLEILKGPQTDLSAFPEPTQGPEGQLFLLGLPLVEAEWLQPNYLIIVPQDRDFVGFLLMFGDRGLAVIHNASRGLALCRGGSPAHVIQQIKRD